MAESALALQDRVLALEAALQANQSALDHVWTLSAAALVLLMQAGFLLLEAGAARSKNSINVAQKNVVDFLIAVSVFGLLGFGFMFGPSLLGAIGDPMRLSILVAPTPDVLVFFIFQAAFVGTAATIVSGAVAERMKFGAYALLAAAISLVIYPVFGHWTWGAALDTDNRAWLADLGFIDFAGSTVVHALAGWVSLAGVIMLGPRLGRFNVDGAPQTMPSHSMVLSGAGAMILLVAWVGFNGGSTLSANNAIGPIIANTLLAGAFGGVVGLALGRALDGHYAPQRMINGMLGALVAITAGCAVVSPVGAILIAISAALIVTVAEDILLHAFKLDDVVGAIAVHGVGGSFGTIALAIFAAPEHLVAGSRAAQLGVQALGVGVSFVWAFGIGALTFALIRATLGLRISVEDERRGLNIAEHGATLGTGALQEALLKMSAAENKVTQALDENTGDEAAEIAAIVNPLIGELHALIESVSGELETSDAELKRAMNDLREARDKAEAANLAKSQFIANMSHELRTPLNAIIGFSEIMLEDATDDGNVRAIDDLNRVISAAKHLLALINEVLDLAKLEAGRSEIECTRFMASTVVAEVSTLIAPAARANGNALASRGLESLGHAHTDVLKLKQCLLNLVANANKFTQGGRVDIQCTRVSGSSGDDLVFAVHDNGIGIAADKLATLFQPFVQSDASITRRFGGTGLGLAITRQIAQALGGDVSARSEEGKGSVFLLRIPAVHSSVGHELSRNAA